MGQPESPSKNDQKKSIGSWSSYNLGSSFDESKKLYFQGQALHKVIIQFDKMILSKDLMWSYNLISQKKIIFNFRSIFNYFLTHWFQGPFKWPLSIFLSTGANLKIIEKKADLWGAKNWRRFDPKQFFWTFYVEKSWKCFSRR